MNLVRRRALALALALVALLPVSRAAAQWASLGEMPAPKRERATLVFQNSQGTVAVSALTPQVVRVRFAPGPSLGRDHSYAILAPPPGDAAAQVEVGATASVVRTSALRVLEQEGGAVALRRRHLPQRGPLGRRPRGGKKDEEGNRQRDDTAANEIHDNLPGPRGPAVNL